MGEIKSIRKRNPRRLRLRRTGRRRPGRRYRGVDLKLYTKYARVYDLLFERVFRKGRSLAIEMLDLVPGDRLLEVGVGTGLSFRYIPRGVEMTGIDVSTQMLREARQRRRRFGRVDIRLEQMDATKLDFADGTFNKILATHVLSTISNPLRALEEMKRVCEPDGAIAVSNRFQSGVPVVRAAEKAMNPLTRRLGFVLDLPLDLLTRDQTLDPERMQRVMPGGIWCVVKLVKTEVPAEVVSA